MLRPHVHYPHYNIGRKGSVIYYTWHDVPCVRSYTKPRNPQTALQQSNRGMHASLTRLSGITKEFRRFCYDGLDTYRSSHTAFIGIQMCQLKRVSSVSDKPLAARIRWGRGSLPGAQRMDFCWKESPHIKWVSEKSNGFPSSRLKDQALWIVWNASRNEWQWSLNAGRRSKGRCCLNLPHEWRGERLFMWLLFYDSRKKRFSHDICLEIKEGYMEGSCRLDTPLLYTKEKCSYNFLVVRWCLYRSLNYEQKKEFVKGIT